MSYFHGNRFSFTEVQFMHRPANKHKELLKVEQLKVCVCVCVQIEGDTPHLHSQHFIHINTVGPDHKDTQVHTVTVTNSTVRAAAYLSSYNL